MRCRRLDDCRSLADDPWDEVIQNLDLQQALQQLSEAERELLLHWLDTNTPATPEVIAILQRLQQALQ